ncbi:phosphoribosylformylglycinamidine synthase subunit PurL [Candidatus Methylacidiphilum fumarolicum]|uniref:Phosphoribosylformylglycinamidine synthase subunit PurL n=3 Tax=Candidatus Methylacidiphilum fumarolicum TaxID=591154 RepID=I0JZW9_METFB|nr:phosphoribosylformylglycinamidine synthase subunit PurL [Candidatus Methylacidiphilum fumarolicum]CCG92788.1 Phosphoribosylformylglycinamidine synthase 2 [Methylacidiphilum fumariolicum SolV]TFE67657.1 phosphoribosylformylglycinamidine synthase II [Candidatus Methylacidiphilum fumarolicum]TFE71759.1 phosphoribosylformylglycinamidine synthase subunit PurL [Candidatus Methylacidiphilum fumarolicum]TFE71865.1 phosphoribosylformylglycinamidine synthase subunit PurL [Candidatus Methylacidiphilum 
MDMKTSNEGLSAKNGDLLEELKSFGLSFDEYQRLAQLLGRVPTRAEMALIGVMWSEHCCYKSSKRELKKLPTTGKRVLVKAGEENAGVVDLGNGWAVVFKIESHNHPSAVEPFQGAATGVGGIFRDIFTMGARPVCFMNSLRFGEIRAEKSTQASHNAFLLRHVVAGIAHYGNCVGVPTVGGELAFDSSYEGNPLVNVFCLGVVRVDQIQRGKAEGIGNPVFIAGSKTGRDGLKGAAFASRKLEEQKTEERYSVQIADPFMGRILMSACLELFQEPGVVVGIQDMGAAGLICSTSETAARAKRGMEINLDNVPVREADMQAEEILLSESQERMLLIIHKDKVDRAKAVFTKWGVPFTQIGQVIKEEKLCFYHRGRKAIEISPDLIVHQAPVYELPATEPLMTNPSLPPLEKIPQPIDYKAFLLAFAALPQNSSREWIYRQFDYLVGLHAIEGPGADAAVLRVILGNEPVRLAATLDGNGRYCGIDPYNGAKLAVAEAIRNLSVVGALPLGITDNLNFADPNNSLVYWQFKEAIRGIADACRFFDIPVTGGNVSFYNYSKEGAILPTPVIGAVGLIESDKPIPKLSFQRPGETIVLLGGWGEGLQGSLYLQEWLGITGNQLPWFHLEAEKKHNEVLRLLISEGLVSTAHDLSEGGLALALIESIGSGRKKLGCSIVFPTNRRLDELLFNEAGARTIVSVPKNKLSQVLCNCQHKGLEAVVIGEVLEDYVLKLHYGAESIELKGTEIEESWKNGLDALLSTT